MVDRKRIESEGQKLGSGSVTDRSPIHGPASSNLSESDELYLLRAMINCVPDYLFVKDTKSRFVLTNPPVAEDLGLTVKDLFGKTDFELHSRERAQEFYADEQEVLRSGRPQIDIKEFVVTLSGTKKWLSTSKLPLRNPRGDIVGIVGISRDITERERAEAALLESENRWNFALESAGQGVWDINLKNGTGYFSPTWRRMRGIGLDEAIDPSREAWLSRIHPEDRERLRQETEEQNSGRAEQSSLEYRERHRDGYYIWILTRGKAVEWEPDGSALRVIGTDTDITGLKLAEARAAEEKEQTYRRHLAALEKAHEATEAAHQLAQSMARHDALTGLPNRRVFAETLQAAVNRAARGSISNAILIIDLDRFKPVNDIHGHAAGDEVLREVATRLAGLVRSSDTVARLGGDEFGVILECIAPEEPGAAATALAERVIASVGRPISVGRQTVDVGASIGIAICPDDGNEPDTLLRAADMAMYRAKEDGRRSFRFFKRSMEKALRERIALEEDVRRAVLANDIRPHYQPLMKLAENRLVGFEILARWVHPERGEVQPEVFIPIVEKLGLIGDLTYYLLRSACQDARLWPADISIALNVSPLHFADPLLPIKLLAILSENDFPPSRLEVEITESALVADLGAARAALAALQGLGIKISLDDFGTGYSSLYNLRELRFDKIKIDRSFVLSMGTDVGSAKIVHSVLDLAKSLGLPTIAEGIEHAQAVKQIIASGGEYGQGFFFGKAMPASEADKLVHGQRTSGLKASI